MIHEQVDIARWKHQFPATADDEADTISSPWHPAVLEQLRERAFGRLPANRALTDVFLWARGEPAQRAGTKIGGLPYRAVGKPWPVDVSGHPMTFLAQFCFVDSLDLVPPLPGDILLIFAQVTEWHPGEYGLAFGSDGLAFEWTSLGNQPLVTSREVPDSKFPILPCYGAIYRTWDATNVEGANDPELARDCAVVDGTKIGGIPPRLFDQDEDRFDDSLAIPTEPYLCTLAYVAPSWPGPYPFLNVPDSIPYAELKNSRPLMIADCGVLNFFLKADGTIRWTGHCRT